MENKRILIGYWNNSHDDYPEYPLPVTQNSSSVDRELYNKIADYLDSGSPVNSYRGSSVCRCCGKNIGNNERCDDKYVWPIGLSHYVREHYIVLPDEFIKHILGNVGYEAYSGNLIKTDLSFWIKWGNTGRSKKVIDFEKMIVDSFAKAISKEFDDNILNSMRARAEIGKEINHMTQNNHTFITMLISMVINCAIIALCYFTGLLDSDIILGMLSGNLIGHIVGFLIIESIKCKGS